MYMISVGLPDDVAKLVSKYSNDFVASMIVKALRRCYMDKRGRNGSMLRASMDLLESALKQNPREPGDIIAMARLIGIGESALYKAKKRMGIESIKSGFGPGAVWLWRLPPTHEIFVEDRVIQETSGVRLVTYKVAPSVDNPRLRRNNLEFEEAVNYLKDMLKNGPMSVSQLIDIGNLTGVGYKALYKAKRDLKIVSIKQGYKSGWCWKLP